MSVLTEINRIKNAATAIVNAIKDKGVTVPTNAKIDDLAPLILSIENSNNESFEYGTVLVRNHSSSNILAVNHYDIAIFPDWFHIDQDGEESMDTARRLPMYVIGNAPIDVFYNEEECQCAGQDNVLCVLLTADYTEIDIYDA